MNIRKKSSIICISAVMLSLIMVIFLGVKTMKNVEDDDYSQGITSFTQSVTEPPTNEPSLSPTNHPSLSPTSNPLTSPTFAELTHCDFIEFISSRWFPIFSAIFIFIGCTTTIFCNCLCGNNAKQNEFGQQPDEDSNSTESADATETDNGTESSEDIISYSPTQYDTDLRTLLACIGAVASCLYINGLAVKGRKSDTNIDTVDGNIKFAKTMAKNVKSRMLRQYLKWSVGIEIYAQENKPIFYQLRHEMRDIPQFNGCNDTEMDNFLIDFMSILGSEILREERHNEDDELKDDNVGI